MKISNFDAEFDATDVEFTSNKTTFYVDMLFYREHELFHILQRCIDFDYSTDPDDDPEIYYDYLSFDVDAHDLDATGIASALVNFLGKYKLYLHHYEITKNMAYVSYATLEPGEQSFHDISYRPNQMTQEIRLKAYVQLVDNVDYDELLNIKLKEPVEKIDWDTIHRLGYEMRESGTYEFVIFDDETTKRLLEDWTPGVLGRPILRGWGWEIWTIRRCLFEAGDWANPQRRIHPKVFGNKNTPFGVFFHSLMAGD